MAEPTRIEAEPPLREDLLRRAGRRCECHGSECRHHRATSRCPRGLRGTTWHVVRRTEGAGTRLWNLWAICDACMRALVR